MPKLDILGYLSRNDKWSLGGGRALLWAPTHPQWLDLPGFWDGARFCSYEFQPVFAITLLDGRGKRIVPKFRRREWNPAFLTQEYEASGKISIIEKKALLPNDTLVCELTLKNNGTVPQAIHYMLWTAQPTFADLGRGFLSHVLCDGTSIRFTRGLMQRDGGQCELACSLGVNRSVTSYSINASQPVPNLPHWEYSPFCDAFSGKKLASEILAGDLNGDGLVYMALHISLKLNPHARTTICGAAGIGGDPPSAHTHLLESLKSRNPIRVSLSNWRSFFENVPCFECSDQYLQKYYWYRWYNLKLLGGEAAEAPAPSQRVDEQPADSRVMVSCSGRASLRETRWLRTADMARRGIPGFSEDRRNGGMQCGCVPAESWAADWGEAVLDLQAVHPDNVFLKKACRLLAGYARSLDEKCDREGSGLYDIERALETGHELSSRFPDTGEDMKQGDLRRLKGVDATTCNYRLKQALHLMAEKLGENNEAASWAEGAERIRQAMLKVMWDDRQEMFFDVEVRTMKRTGVKAASCFYPYLTDIVDERHVAGLKQHLLNPEEFWTPFPVASLSRDDGRFNPAGEWNGVRMLCPDNGRVWPLINCRLIEALANISLHQDPALRRTAAGLLSSSVRMMFRKGDVRFPGSYDHYHPLTGRPCLYRGVNDHQSSWFVDLIIRHVAGIRPTLDGIVVVDPFPCDTGRVHMDGIPFQGHLLGIDMDEQNIVVYADGKQIASGKRGERLEVRI